MGLIGYGVYDVQDRSYFYISWVAMHSCAFIWLKLRVDTDRKRNQ